MSGAERKIALQVLGFGSSSKILANPHPLGGYEGIEFGVSSEFIPVTDLTSLGDKSAKKSELNYYTFSIAKGIYYNVDTALHFTPAFQGESISSFGAQLRWGFHEFRFMKGGLSLLLHANASSYTSLVDTRTTGADILATFVVDDIALYAGVGEGRTVGTFIGGEISGGLTESTTDDCDVTRCNSAYEDLKDSHTIFGVSIAFNDMFLAFQIDRYYLSTYSGRLGWRF